MIRVLVVRDGGYFGIPVRTLLSGQPDIEIVGTLAFAGELASKAAETVAKLEGTSQAFHMEDAISRR